MKMIWLCIMSSIAAVTAYHEMVIADLIMSYTTPKTVIGVTCWTASQKLSFYGALAKQNVMLTFANSTDIVDSINEKQQIVYVLDFNCNDVQDALQTNENIFRPPYRWVVINSNVPDLGNVLVDTEVAVVSQTTTNYYEIYYIYRINSNGPWIKENYGYWTSGEGLVLLKLEPVVAARRLNLNGVELRICYVLTNNNSIDHLVDGKNDHIDTITKVNFPTTNHLIDFMNATRKYVFTETWGYKQANDTWNGMSGYLARDEVDIGGKYPAVDLNIDGSPMFFTSERLSIVEYISSPTPTRSKFVFQQPKLSYENNLFLLSFQAALWYGSSALICLTFLVLFAVAMWEWKKSGDVKDKRIKNAGILRPNVIDVALLTFGATCQQGSPVELKGSLGRMVLLLLFVSLTFLYTSFSANIVALLQSSSSEIKTLADLLNSRIKFGVHDTVFNRYYFATESEPIRRAIYERKVAPPGAPPRFMDMEDGVKEMRKGLFAFHMETGVGYKFVGKYFEEGEKCGLKEIQYLRVIDPWLAVKKDTPFMEMFKIGTKRLQEHGLQQRENHLLYAKRPKCSGRQASFVSVSMVDCYPALLVLSYGALVSVLVATVEVLVDKKHHIMMKFKSRLGHVDHR